MPVSQKTITTGNPFGHWTKSAQRVAILGTTGLALILGGCATETGTGALIGAGAGAVIGSDASRPGRRGEGALAGAAIGAIIGAIIGNEIEEDRNRRDRDFVYADDGRFGDYEYESGVYDWSIGDIDREARQQEARNRRLRSDYYELERLADDARDPRTSQYERRRIRDDIRNEKNYAREALDAVNYRLRDVDDAMRGAGGRRRNALRDYRRELMESRRLLQDIIRLPA